ncbi:MAG TPA: hypothetical protein VFO89_07875 [Thermoanaerobaculia bacterium]|nr:hypothetical protein [Thermoanaerobaculia bacterium]
MTYGAIGRFLLPMGEPLVRRWFDRTLYAPPGIRARVRRLAGGPRLRRAEKSAEIDALRALLTEVADAVPRGPAIFVRDYDTSDRGRVVAFFFREGESAPCVMAKAQFGASALPAEAETLEHLRATLPAELLSTLPRVLRSHVSARGEILLTTVLPGRSSYVELMRSLAPSRLFARHFAIAGRWLAAFHRATRTSTVSIIDGIEIPHSAAHGDFWPHNVLHDENDAAGVVDWEHCLRDASPFLDVFHYALAYGISSFRRLPAEEAFRRTFHAHNPLARAVQQYLRDYAARAELPPRVLAPAFETFIATRGRMTATTPPRPGAFWRTVME